MTTIGEILRDARARKKLSLRALADKSDLSDTIISQIEHDKIDNPGYWTIRKMAKALGVSMRRLDGIPEPQA